MYEQWHVLVSYAAGTAVGLALFRQFVKERIIATTIDSLVDQEYVRSYEDESGVTHLYKWHEVDDILERIRIVYETDYEDLSEEEEKVNEHDQDDTP
jgi:hypothetical protein